MTSFLCSLTFQWFILLLLKFTQNAYIGVHTKLYAIDMNQLCFLERPT